MIKFVARSILFLAFAVLSVPASAGNYNNVYVGSEIDYRPISTVQLRRASTDREKVTVAQTIANSNDASIRNGYNGVGNTELLVTRFWHLGGTMQFDKTWQHITIKIYKNDTYEKTCHAYSFKTALNGDGDL